MYSTASITRPTGLAGSLAEATLPSYKPIRAAPNRVPGCADGSGRSTD
jgi:hypothetical protein